MLIVIGGKILGLYMLKENLVLFVMVKFYLIHFLKLGIRLLYLKMD